MQRNGKNTRVYILAGILMVWGAAISARLVYLQVFCYGEYAQRAQRQQQRTTEVAAKRGISYERAGRELATSCNVGNRSRNSAYFGTTRDTCVCCSISSETST